MKRNGVTILELLIGLTILGTVASMAMYIFRSQHRSWKDVSDNVDIGLMAKATLDEIGGAVRMAGAGLPEGRAGILVASAPAVGVTVVSNASRWCDKTGGFLYDPSRRILRLAVDSAAGFSDSGYAYFQIRRPLPGVHAAPTIDTMFTLPILERIVHSGSCASDSLVLDASELVASPNYWTSATDIEVLAASAVYNVDSIGYFQSHDSVFIRPNRKAPMLFAIGVDSLSLQYHHPVDGWRRTLSNSAPSQAVDMVRVRVVTRSLRKSKSLEERDRRSNGHLYARLETEVSLRNDRLVNR